MTKFNGLGGRKLWRKIYNWLPFTTINNIDAFFKGNISVAGEILAQGLSIMFERALSIGGIGRHTVITDLVASIQHFLGLSKVIDGLSQESEYVDWFAKFTKDDIPLGQPQPNDSETFNSIQFEDKLTGSIKYYFAVTLPSGTQVVTKTWYFRSPTGLTNAFIRVMNGFQSDPNSEDLYWKSNTDKQIKEKTDLVTANPGAGVDITFPLGEHFIEEPGDVFTYFFIADNNFTTQGATIDLLPIVGPPFGITEIPYIKGDGSEWRYTKIIDETTNSFIQTLDTGIISGGIITINGGDNTLFNVSEGTGRIVNMTDPVNPTFKDISWDAFIGESVPNISGDIVTSLLIDINGDLQKNGNVVATPQVRRLNITLGSVTHPELVISEVLSNPDPVYQTLHAFIDYANALGGIINGSAVRLTNPDKTFSQELGKFTLPYVNYANDINNPSTILNSASLVKDFFYSFQDGIGGFNTITPTNGNEVNAEVYDDGSGSLASVPNPNKWQFQPCYFFGQTNQIILIVGQKTYQDKEDVLDAIRTDFSEMVNSPLITENGTLIGYFIIEKGLSDLTDDTEADFVDPDQVTSSGGGGATSYLQLSDTNDSYLNNAGKVPVVNEAETALEFVEFKPNTFSYPYEWDTNTDDTDPGDGKAKGNNPILADITVLYVSQKALQNIDLSAQIYDNLLSGDVIFYAGQDSSVNNIRFKLDATPVKSGNYYQISGVVQSTGGVFGNQLQLISSFFFT